jgi:hypothetical protein
MNSTELLSCRQAKRACSFPGSICLPSFTSDRQSSLAPIGAVSLWVHFFDRFQPMHCLSDVFVGLTKRKLEYFFHMSRLLQSVKISSAL